MQPRNSVTCLHVAHICHHSKIAPISDVHQLAQIPASLNSICHHALYEPKTALNRYVSQVKSPLNSQYSCQCTTALLGGKAYN